VRYWGAVVSIAVALFFVGRLVPRARAERAVWTEPGETGRSDPAAPAPGSSAAQRAAMQTLLNRLARMPRPTAPPLVTQTLSNIEHSTVEPAEVTQKRRARVLAEIDERAPGVSQSKRTILLAEADRLAWDKREFRAAFLSGKMSEPDYIDALKDDIRAALSNFEEALTAEEYIALFNRGPGKDPFALESLVGRPPSKSDQPEIEGSGSPNAPSKSGAL
jgi:hypothetical protein